MSAFVLDNSVAMRWLLASNKPNDQRYAESVLRSMAQNTAVVPNLWHLEAANVMLTSERSGVLDIVEIENFCSQLEALPISTDAFTSQQALVHTLAIARAQRLSSYDAAYLELALRKKLPIATLDADLRRACEKNRVARYTGK